MESQFSWPHLQQPATYLCSESHQSFQTISLISLLILSSHLCLGLQISLFPSGFPAKALYTPHLYPIRSIFPAHLNFLNLITRIRGESAGNKACHSAAVGHVWLSYTSCSLNLWWSLELLHLMSSTVEQDAGHSVYGTWEVGQGGC